MITEILFVIVVLVAWLWYREYTSWEPGFPKGPPSLPLVGSLPFLGKDPLATFQKLKEKYGPIVGVNFAGFHTVMLNDPQWIKEAYEMDVFAGRPALPPLMVLTGGRKIGLVPSEGKTWSEQRRFTLRNLRDFGFGKKSMEGMIHEDIERVLAEFKKSGGAPIATAGMFSVAVLSSLWQILTGEKPRDESSTDSGYSGDEKFKRTLESLRKLIQSLNLVSPATVIYSWLAVILPKSLAWVNPLYQVFNPIKVMVGSYIDQHKRTFDEANLRDFIDVYLQEMKSTKDPSSSFHGKRGDENILIVILNLLGAGAETTSNTINWAILLLSLNPEMLKKVQAELDLVVGRDRLPSLDDRPDCTYTEAVMQEVFRYSSIAPFGVFHNTMNAIEFHGYKLPKDTMVMANLYGVHFDRSIWGDPETFRPERHLSPDEKTLKRDKPIYAFSVGKRVCLGEVLARNEFFLFLTAICQRFTFVPNPNAPTPNPMDTLTSVFRFPKPFELCFTERA